MQNVCRFPQKAHKSCKISSEQKGIKSLKAQLSGGKTRVRDLGRSMTGSHEVRGSIPLGSTNYPPAQLQMCALCVRNPDHQVKR